jgi:AraC family transcriptional regulator
MAMINPTVKLEAGHFYGVPTRSATVAGCKLLECNYSSGVHLPMHSHEHAHLCLVLAGEYVEKVRGKQLERRKYSIVFHPGELPHAEQTSIEGRQFIVDVDPRYLKRCVTYTGPLDQPLDACSGAIVWLAHKLYKEFREMDSVSPLAMEGLLLELFSDFARRNKARSEKTPPRWLLQLDDLLRTRFLERLDFGELAAEVAVSPAYLSRNFRKFRGCTVGDYVRNLRVAWAAQKLNGTAISIADVAVEAGYFDQSHFTRVFKATTGLTPCEFRRNARPKMPPSSQSCRS